MNVFARRLLGGSSVAAAVLGGFLIASTGADAEPSIKYRGEFSEYMAGVDNYDISGQVKMKIDSSSTKVSIEISGLAPGVVYGSHLHNGTCASGGGGHYKDDVTGPVDAINEIWLSSFDLGMGIMADEGAAVALANGEADWVARTEYTRATNAHTWPVDADGLPPTSDARSVVVHAPNGARIACADLILSRVSNGVRNNF